MDCNTPVFKDRKISITKDVLLKNMPLDHIVHGWESILFYLPYLLSTKFFFFVATVPGWIETQMWESASILNWVAEGLYFACMLIGVVASQMWTQIRNSSRYRLIHCQISVWSMWEQHVLDSSPFQIINPSVVFHKVQSFKISGRLPEEGSRSHNLNPMNSIIFFSFDLLLNNSMRYLIECNWRVASIANVGPEKQRQKDQQGEIDRVLLMDGWKMEPGSINF